MSHITWWSPFDQRCLGPRCRPQPSPWLPFRPSFPCETTRPLLSWFAAVGRGWPLPKAAPAARRARPSVRERCVCGSGVPWPRPPMSTTRWATDPRPPRLAGSRPWWSRARSLCEVRITSNFAIGPVNRKTTVYRKVKLYFYTLEIGNSFKVS